MDCALWLYMKDLHLRFHVNRLTPTYIQRSSHEPSRTMKTRSTNRVLYARRYKDCDTEWQSIFILTKQGSIPKDLPHSPESGSGRDPDDGAYPYDA